MKRGRSRKNSGSTFWIIILCVVIVLLCLFIFSKSCSHKVNTFSTNQLVSYFPNKQGDMLFDAYAGPSKNNEIHVRSKDTPSFGVPINVPTQGMNADYRQIGIVSKNGPHSQIFPLIGKPLMSHRDKWQYYVLNKQNIKLPVIINGKNSTNEYGTDSLENNDVVSISGHSNQPEFKVELYENNQHQYIPI